MTKTPQPLSLVSLLRRHLSRKEFPASALQGPQQRRSASATRGPLLTGVYSPRRDTWSYGSQTKSQES